MRCSESPEIENINITVCLICLNGPVKKVLSCIQLRITLRKMCKLYTVGQLQFRTAKSCKRKRNTMCHMDITGGKSIKKSKYDSNLK